MDGVAAFVFLPSAPLGVEKPVAQVGSAAPYCQGCAASTQGSDATSWFRPTVLHAAGAAAVAAVGIYRKESWSGKRQHRMQVIRRRAAEEEEEELFQPSAQVGAVAPLGYFDPLNFAKVGDEDGFKELRRAEIKHGRVAMMASIGLVAQHFVEVEPGHTLEPAYGYTSPHGMGAAYNFFGSVGFTTLILFLTAIAAVEIVPKEGGRWPGDFGDPLRIGWLDEDTRNKELNNGRFAMICVMGILAAELATGKDAIEQLGF